MNWRAKFNLDNTGLAGEENGIEVWFSTIIWLRYQWYDQDTDSGLYIQENTHDLLISPS